MAYIIGGEYKIWGGKSVDLCQIFDVQNQKVYDLGRLNIARFQPGTIKFKSSLYVFGGTKGMAYVDQIERHNLIPLNPFVPIDIKGHSFLMGQSFCTYFSSKHEVIIAGRDLHKLYKLNFELNLIEEHDAEFKYTDQFDFVHQGYQN